MTRSLTATMRRVNRLLRPAKLGKVARSVQSTLAGSLIKTSLAPLAALKPKTKRRKSAASKTGMTLGVVLKQLRLAQSYLPTTSASLPEDVSTIPDGARYLARTHRTAAGSRGYKIYLPAGQDRPTGMILMLHGCNQGPDDFALGTHMNAHAEKHGLAIVYPAQGGMDNAASCWNWFKPDNQARGKGEPALLASLARKLMREHGLGRDEVFVAGLSAGGAMAAILADVYPDVFSAAGIHSGLARGSARNVLSAMSAMRSGGTALGSPVAPAAALARRIIFHGDSDSTVHPSNATTIVISALGEDAAPAKVIRRSARGRSYARSDYADADGTVRLELWMLEGAGHAWSGGKPAGSYTEPSGPDASAEMVRFFLEKSA